MKIFIITLLSFVAITTNANAVRLGCSIQNVGAVACVEQRMCECKFFRPGKMTGERGGYRWDCGITRPVCLKYDLIDGQNGYQGPHAVGLDNSNNSTTITSNPTSTNTNTAGSNTNTGTSTNTSTTTGTNTNTSTNTNTNN